MSVRSSGVLMPIFSLPSPYGVGTLGRQAREFADFLARSGQSHWQILPIGPTGYGDSPYQSFSSRAGNPYLIDLDELERQGLLEREEYASLPWGDDPERVDYQALYRLRLPVLRRACDRLLSRPPAAFDRFCLLHQAWLDDYALFMALKEQYGGAPWLEWPEDIRLRRPRAMARAKKELEDDIRFWQGVQYLFFRQWQEFKSYVNGKGISIVGDLPIYVAGDSADVWAAPEQFLLDDQGRPTLVAGVPPDDYSADGQLWGNPLFRWDRMKQDGYAWWLDRVAFQFEIYDVLRLDHFRGFESYYAIPYGEKTARNGQWLPGPGMDFFRALRRSLGPRPIIAEDLGFLTPEVYQLLADTGFPGMKVLEFGFGDPGEDSEYLPHNYPVHSVAYPGTHDNDTILGWLDSLTPEQAKFARHYLRLSRREGLHWGVLRSLWASPARLTVVQMQDLLGLDRRARMNTPSTLGGNWQWRALPEAMSAGLARRLYRETAAYQRLPRPRGGTAKNEE